MVEYAYKENGVMKLKPVALSLSQSEIDEIATELLEAMQPDWQNAITLTPSQVTSGYVCPADGMIVGYSYPNSGNTAIAYINNTIVARSDYTPGNVSFTNIQCQVNAGDVFTVSNIDVGGYSYSFVPFKTSNPVSLRPLDPHKIDTAILNHWDDITSDFSIPGSTSGAVLSSVKYNPVLQQLKLIVKKTTSTPASSNFKLFLQYNGSEPIAFGDNTILFWNHVGPANGELAGLEFGTAVVASNKLQIDSWNRNSSSAWAANDTFRGIIWL